MGGLAPFLSVFKTGYGGEAPRLEGSIPSPRRESAIRFRARPARGEVGVAARRRLTELERGWLDRIPTLQRASELRRNRSRRRRDCLCLQAAARPCHQRSRRQPLRAKSGNLGMPDHAPQSFRKFVNAELLGAARFRVPQTVAPEANLERRSALWSGRGLRPLCRHGVGIDRRASSSGFRLERNEPPASIEPVQVRVCADAPAGIGRAAPMRTALMGLEASCAAPVLGRLECFGADPRGLLRSRGRRAQVALSFSVSGLVVWRWSVA